MNLIGKIMRISGYFKEMILFIVLYPFARIVYRNRHIRLFSERGCDARDNGYYMYRFYRKNHPELESYYVIDKTSSDRNKVMELGNVVDYRSLKHRMLFIIADYKISTHIMGCSPNIDFYAKFADKIHLRGFRVFLQHGVTSSDIPALYSNKTNLDIFICGAKPEYDFISGTYGYKNNEVKYTGFARYDGLHDVKTERQILFMPTWRKYLKYDRSLDISQSEYVNKWNSLINNRQLVAALRDNDLKLIFYPHYEMQRHLYLFKSEYEEVVVAGIKDFDVQQLLKESKLLITDYSSVFYDFAYMKKPVVYYQFDKEQYFGEHYAKGYFDCETMGFGEVAEQEPEAVDVILSYISSGFEIKADYKKRINNFFPLYDSQNCQRIFNEIEAL